MYVVANANTSIDHSSTKSGSTDKDPDSASAKYVHRSTRLTDSKIRMDCTHEQGRCVDIGVTEKGQSTLLNNAPVEGPRKAHPRRTAGCPGRAAGRTAPGPMAFERSTKLRPRA
eukprot:9068131-Lingulodinium_polyedra.AAC.1